MSDKKKDLSAQSRREDEVLNRALLWIGGAAVMILLLLLTNRYYVRYRASEVAIDAALARVILPVVTVAGLAACVVGVLLALSARKKGQSMKWPVTLAVFCGTLAVAAGVVWRFHGTGVQVMCAVIPSVAVLALVYYLFQREFFAIAVLTGVGIAGLWLVRHAGSAHTAILYAYLVLAAALLVAAALFARKLQSEGGLWNGKQLLSKNAAYTMIYVTCAVVAVLLIAALVAGAGVAYYLMFPAVGWLVVMAVYFTVKLM